jgi:S-phase kinase-associated protein 1
MGDKTTITLRSAEGDEIMVERRIAMRSGAICKVLDVCEDESEPLEMPLVKKRMLALAFDYCAYHQAHDDEEAREASIVYDLADAAGKEASLAARRRGWAREDVLAEKDEKFCAQLDLESKIELIYTANSLEIVPLVKLAADSVAKLIKGKTAEQIRKILQIENDFTPEEEEEIRKQNDWCEETA